MSNNKERTTIKDVINYVPETYLSTEDIDLIRSTFKNNPRLLRVLQKVMLPSVGDPAMPIEEIGGDVWLNMDFSQMQDSEIKPIVLARQDAIKFIAGGLIKLKVIANDSTPSPMNAELKRKQDSTQ